MELGFESFGLRVWSSPCAVQYSKPKKVANAEAWGSHLNFLSTLVCLCGPSLHPPPPPPNSGIHHHVYPTSASPIFKTPLPKYQKTHCQPLLIHTPDLGPMVTKGLHRLQTEIDRKSARDCIYSPQSPKAATGFAFWGFGGDLGPVVIKIF